MLGFCQGLRFRGLAFRVESCAVLGFDWDVEVEGLGFQGLIKV